MDEPSAARERNFQRLQGLRGRFAGEQCVVLCTGPSAMEVDLTLIDKHPFVMGVNGSYLLRNSFHSYFADNSRFVQNNLGRIAQIEADRIFVRRDNLATCLEAGIDESRLHLYDGPVRAITAQISTDITASLPLGPTVLLGIAFPALLWCGFVEILLIGADFPRQGYQRFYAGHAEEPKQDRRSMADFEREMEIARFRASLWARYLAERHPGVRVLNCSPRSELEAFRKVDLPRALGESGR